MTRARLLLVVSLGLAGVAGGAAQTPSVPPDPDALFDAREHLDNALAAADIWAGALVRNPDDYEAAWKLARAAYWLGSHVPAEQRRAQYERGLAAGRRAVTIAPLRPEGRFWLAATMGSLAESFGVMAGLRYRGAIKRELEIVLDRDPGYLDGAADRALGRWYFRVPRLFGGNRTRAIEHLQRSLSYDPLNAASNFFLAEVYLSLNREPEARQHLERVLEAAETRAWGPEVREFKAQARALLASTADQ